jgi:hypothetical protein
LVWGPTSFIAYERGWVIFEYSHVFRSGGSLMRLVYVHESFLVLIHVAASSIKVKKSSCLSRKLCLHPLLCSVLFQAFTCGTGILPEMSMILWECS